MLETKMRKLHLLLKMMGAGVVGALALTFTGQPASAQTTTNQPPVTANPATKKPTSATPQMIEVAIQRSQARSAKAKSDPSKPEQRGSEEPFTYITGRTF
jgi:hypothetical protein